MVCVYIYHCINKCTQTRLVGLLSMTACTSGTTHGQGSHRFLLKERTQPSLNIIRTPSTADGACTSTDVYMHTQDRLHSHYICLVGLHFILAFVVCSLRALTISLSPASFAKTRPLWKTNHLQVSFSSSMNTGFRFSVRSEPQVRGS